MRAQTHLAGVAMVAVALSLGACLQVERWVLTIDVAAKRAVLDYRNISSSAKPGHRGVLNRDFKSLITGYLKGDKLAKKHPRWQLESKELLEEDGQLHGRLRFSFKQLSDVGVMNYDASRPYRYCPSAERLIVASIARWRDTAGCVIWPAGATKLQVEEVVQPSETGPSLVTQYRAWRKTTTAKAATAP